MRNLTKGLLGAFAAVSVAATAMVPAHAGISTSVSQPQGVHKLDQDNGFYKKRSKYRQGYRDGRRDQRLSANSRVWRGNDGRYHCKRDDGTTGLLIGAAVGGLAGHEIAGNGDKLLGTIIGGGAGALLGREIDRDKYRCR